MGFKLKSGNATSFKLMGGTEQSPAKDMKTGSYKQSFESPAKQKLTKGGEGQDQNKIFNEKGEHIGDWVNDKKVMFTTKLVKNTKKGMQTLDKIKREGKMQTLDKTKRGGDWEKLKNKKSPAKHFVDDVPEHNDPPHSDDLQTPEEHDTGRLERKMDKYMRRNQSPAKQTATHFADGSKKSARDKFSDRETAAEQRKALARSNAKKQLQRKAKKEVKLKDLRGTPTPKDGVNLSKMSGFGPSTAFGGVKNPELDGSRKGFKMPKVMKDGPKNKVHGIKDSGDWQPHQFRK